MQECDWDRKLPSVRSTETKMARILMRDDEKSLLAAIQSDSIFGFAICSIETPQTMIDEFEKVTSVHTN